MSEAKEIASIEKREESSVNPSKEGGNGSAEPCGTRAVRRRLPDERHSLTHHFSVGGQEGYVTIGLYEDGLPGEMFIRMAKEGSTVSGLMDSFATAVSLALQYGVPLQVLYDKFSHTRFEPSGWSGNPKIGYAKSLMDYLFRWLELRFLKGEQGILFDLQGQGQPLRQEGSVGVGRRAGRCACMPVLRLVDGEKRFLLSLHGMWQHEWMLVNGSTRSMAWRKA